MNEKTVCASAAWLYVTNSSDRDELTLDYTYIPFQEKQHASIFQSEIIGQSTASQSNTNPIYSSYLHIIANEH